MRLKMEQALGVGRWPAQRTPGGAAAQNTPQQLPHPPTIVHVNNGGGGGASWKTLALLGGASVGFVAWLRYRGYTWENIAYVTQNAFHESVETLEQGIDGATMAIEATREHLRAKIGEVEQQLTEATDGLHRHIEEQVGAARADIGDVRQALAETDEALQQVHDEMATEAQVEELRLMLGEGQRTADMTSDQVARMRLDMGSVAQDVSALRELVAAQYAEQQRWVSMQLESAASSTLQVPQIFEMRNGRESTPTSPSSEPHVSAANGIRAKTAAANGPHVPSCSGSVAASLLYSTGSALAVVAGNTRPRGLGLGATGGAQQHRTAQAH